MRQFITAVKRVKKAIAAFVTPAIPLLVIAVQDSSPGGQNITQNELIGMVVVCLSTAIGVAAAPANEKPAAKPKSEVSEPDNDADEEDDSELEQAEEPLNEE